MEKEQCIFWFNLQKLKLSEFPSPIWKYQFPTEKPDFYLQKCLVIRESVQQNFRIVNVPQQILVPDE